MLRVGIGIGILLGKIHRSVGVDVNVSIRTSTTKPPSI